MQRKSLITSILAVACGGCANPNGTIPNPVLPVVAPTTTSANGEPCKPLGRSTAENVTIGAVGGAAAGAGIAAATGAQGRGTRNAAIAGGLLGALAGYQFGNSIGLQEQADGSVKMDIPGAVLFGTGRADIRTDFMPTLDKVASSIRTYCGVTASIVGFTDSTGTPQGNLKLSVDRAEAVVAYLKQQRVSPDRLSASGRGQSDPIADNRTDSGRQQNRRVEIFVRPPQ